jgi:uncharacterized protein (TIGR00255 family)
MRSMTGMGSASVRRDGVTLRADVRSVNHRFLEVVLRAPLGLTAFEAQVRERVAHAIERGRVSVTLDMEHAGGSMEVKVNDPFVSAFVQAARSLARRHHLHGELEVAQVMARPEVIVTRERVLPERELSALLDQTLQLALTKFDAMREREGKALAKQLRKRITSLHRYLREVERHAAQVPREAQRKLQERLARLGAADSVDPTRLAAEVALLADRSTISEECERLASHLQQFDETIRAGGPAAKRLGFLLQEMHREVNTMGSKSSSLAITNAVVRMKEELENLREQIANLE